jgi:2-iminobutanoate/2-iminopropanoate deaminase
MNLERDALSTAGAPRPVGPYSQGIVSGGFLFVAGQGPLDPETGHVVPGGIEQHARRTIENVLAVAAAAGAGAADTVQVRVYLADLDDFQAMNRVYESYFPEPRPARTTVGASLLGVDIEIDAVFALRSGDEGGRS